MVMSLAANAKKDNPPLLPVTVDLALYIGQCPIEYCNRILQTYSTTKYYGFGWTKYQVVQSRLQYITLYLLAAEYIVL